MNNTIPNVPRELLCELRDAANESMNATTRQHQIDHFAGLIAKADALLSAPSPAGADGLDVVAWQLGCQTMTGEIGWKLSWNQSGAGVCARLKGDEYEQPLCRLSDATSIIDGLRGEVDVMTQHADNYSRMFEECAEQRDQFAGLLREAHDTYRAAIHWEDLRSTMKRIDTALAELPQ